MGFECEQIGTCTLYRADCLEVLPTLGHVDAVITDPPYGHGYDCSRPHWSVSTFRGLRPREGWAPRWTPSAGDADRFDPSPWLAFPQIILWGANHYAPRLPATTAWLVWDKRVGGTSDDQSDAELAWTNLRGPVRLYRHLWRGICRAGEENVVHSPKLHPHQKPLALMRWCVMKTIGTVLDPYMGSGTTGVACVELGRAFIGIECDEDCFDLACRRIEQAYRQLDLFPPVSPPAPQQLRLDAVSASQEHAGRSTKRRGRVRNRGTMMDPERRDIPSDEHT